MEFLVFILILTAAIVWILARPKALLNARNHERKIDFLTVARGMALAISVPQAVLSLFPIGWWLFAAGISALSSDSLEGKLEGFWAVIVVAPLFAVWFLWRDHHRATAGVLVLEAGSLIALSWDRHREEFAWGFLVMAAILAWIALALVAGDRSSRDST